MIPYGLVYTIPGFLDFDSYMFRKIQPVRRTNQSVK